MICLTPYFVVRGISGNKLETDKKYVVFTANKLDELFLN